MREELTQLHVFPLLTLCVLKYHLKHVISNEKRVLQ